MLKETSTKLEEHERDTELLKRFCEKGYIDLNGNPTEKYEDQSNNLSFQMCIKIMEFNT